MLNVAVNDKIMYGYKSVRVSFVGACDVLQHIVCVKESKYGMICCWKISVFSLSYRRVANRPEFFLQGVSVALICKPISSQEDL